MIIYSETLNVYEAAKQRIHKLYDTGRHISVGFSGGKDSTVLLEVTLEVAKERGISKVPVLFLDQEAEYTQTVDYMRYIMNRPEVEPYWIQCPFKLWNASAGEWFIPWEEGKVWMREKEEISFKENVYHVERFTHMLNATASYHFPENYILLGGVRAEEAPARRMALLYGKEVLPGMPYGSSHKKGVVIYPLYDWSYRDIWYYIFENRCHYNKVYNLLAAHKPLRMCRVSSLIHENAVWSIAPLQEIDSDLYAKLYARVKNISTTKHTLTEIHAGIQEPPNMFSSWSEYLNYLIDNIISENYRERFRRKLNNLERAIAAWNEKEKDSMYYAMFTSICTEDIDFKYIGNTYLAKKGKML